MTFRELPSVDAVIRTVREGGVEAPHHLLVDAARAVLAEAREAIRGGGAVPDLEVLARVVIERADRTLRPTLRPVINATGVVIQTNLGRAPLSEAALRAIRAIGTGYSNLEYDLEAGQRGSRYSHLVNILKQLTGAEAALIVNNNAAAVYFVLTVLAQGREVIIARGQAIEIGGGFRIPDILRQSGATLIEVGTTNRTYVQDYEQAISECTAAILRVHTSNFRIVGFAHEPALAELAQLARRYGLPLIDDLGSGSLIDTTVYGLAPEPTVQASISDGADLVTFSGDKLLGGPQAGLIVGRDELVTRLRRHPLARALRVDKLTIAGLEATLASYLRGTAVDELPVWRMIASSLTSLETRAYQLAHQLQAAGVAVQAVACESAIGGGSLPGETLPSVALALTAPDGANVLHQRLRTGTPSVAARIDEDRLLLDLRTVLPEQEPDLKHCIIHAIFGTHRGSSS